MKLLRRLIAMVNPQAGTDDVASEQETFYALMEQAERYHHLEQYDNALYTLSEAEKLAEKLDAPEKQLLIALTRAGIFARQQRTDEARRLLSRMKDEAEQAADSLKLAYVHIAEGVLDQEAGALEDAESHFDAALRHAREVNSMGAEGRAQAHLADVSLESGNASFAVYLLKEALPKLNLSGDVQLNSYFVGRLGEALIEVGDVAEGQQLLGRALRLAEHMGYKDYERQWRRVLASQAMIIGNYADAKRHLMAVLAASKSDAPDYIQMLCRLSHVTMRLGEYNVSHDYARQALDLTEKVTAEPEPLLRTQAMLGIILRMMDRNAEARPYLEAACNGYDALDLRPADPSYVDVLRNLAAAQTVLEDYSAADASYELALKFAEQRDNQSDIAGIQRDRGIMFVHQNDLESAIKSWTAALSLYDMLDEPTRVARLYCDVANLRKQLGQWQRASEDYNHALMLLSSIDDDETRGVILSNAAAAYVDQGDVQTAESFFIDAIKISQKLNDRASEATRRGNYGWFLLSTGRADRAMASLTYALRQSENLGMKLQSAVQTDNMGLAQYELNNLDEALSYQEKALDMIQGVDDAYWTAIIHANLGQTLIEVGRYDDAREHLDSALAYGREKDRRDVIIRALIGLTRCALHDADVERAAAFSAEAMQLAERLNTRRLLADALNVGSVYLAATGDFEAAEDQWKRARKLYNILHLPLQIRTPEWVKSRENKVGE